MKSIRWVLAASVLLLGGCFSRFEVYPEIKDPALMDKKFSVVQLTSDLDFMVDSYKSRHPDWQGRVSLDELQSVQQSLREQITTSMNRQDYFKIIGQLTQTLRDGHSGILFPYPEYERYMAAGGTVFPLELRLDEQYQAFVKIDHEALGVGSQVTAINGQPVNQIISHIAKYARGETEQLRANIAVRELSKWLWHLYDFKGRFDVSYISQGQSFTKQLNGYTRAQLNDEQAGQDTDELSYKALNATTGLMNVNYFGVSEDVFELFIDDSFAKIKDSGITDLIIDIRENPGGSTDNVEYLMQYISAKPCHMVSQVKEKLFEDGLLGGKKGDLKDVSVNTEVTPIGDSKRFAGEVYLLIGKFSYSASIVMATAVQDCKVGTLVGQSTGGFANQTGQINFFELPQTQLRAFVPSRLMIRPNGDIKTQSVIPDVVVRDQLDGIADTVLERTLALITIKNKKK